MLPWLMRLGPMAARAGRGVNLARRRLFAKDPFIKRPAAAGMDAPYTPLTRYTATSGPGRATGPTRLRRDPRLRPGETRMETYPDVPAQMYPRGWTRRNPRKSIAAGVGTGIIGGGTAYGLMAGDEEPSIDSTLAMTTPQPWSAPEDMMSFAESEIARVEEGEENFRKLLQYGGLIGAIGGDPSEFFEKGKLLLEQSEQYAQDKQYAKAVRAVYKEGDMPKSAREAYERLTPLMGPERAAVLSGHQLGMETGKTKEERLWNKIIGMAQSDIESAAAELVAAWGTKRLGGAPDYTDHNLRLAEARRLLEGVVSGGAGYAEGVTSIRPGVAASA